MSHYDYITTSDITDNVLSALATSAYCAEGNDALDALAYEKGVDPTEIDHTTLDYYCKRYCIAWACWRICIDYQGTNNTDLPVEIEKYAVKANIYYEEIHRLSAKITPLMLTGEEDEKSDRALVRTLYRG